MKFMFNKKKEEKKEEASLTEKQIPNETHAEKNEAGNKEEAASILFSSLSEKEVETQPKLKSKKKEKQKSQKQVEQKNKRKEKKQKKPKAQKKSFSLFGLKLGKTFGPKPLISVDSGSQEVKALRVLNSRSSFEVLDCIIHKNTENPEVFLKSYFKEKGFLKEDLAFSIADENVENHEFKVPKLPKNELNKAVDWEIKKMLPSSDYIVRDTLMFETDIGFDVQCVIAPKEMVELRLQEGKDYGLTPKYLETESSALFACLSIFEPDVALDKLALVDLGFSSFRLIFIHKGRISFTRSLYFGLSSICTQVATQLEVSEKEVLSYCTSLEDEAKATDMTKELKVLTQMIEESLYTLCEEFGRSEFFVREKSLEEVSEVYLCGGGACISKIVSYMQENLHEKTVRLLNPFEKIKELPKGIKRSRGPQWAVACGLAAREAS